MGIDRSGLFEIVRALQLPAGEYVVFGSGPLVVRGLRKGNDIDLVVTADLYERLRTDGWASDIKDDGGEVLRQGDVEAMRQLEFPGYSRAVDALIDGAEWIDGVPFATLGELRTFKVAMNRAKDHVDIELIDQELAANLPRTPTTAEIAKAEAVLAAGRAGRRRAASSWRGTVRAFLVGALGVLAVLVLFGFLTVLVLSAIG